MMNTVNNVKEIIYKINFILSKKQRKRSIVLIFIILVGAGFETIGVSAILPFVQALMTPEELSNNIFIYKLMNVFNVKTDVGVILMVGIGVMLIYLVKNIYLSISSYIQLKFQCSVEEEISVELLDSYMKRPYVFFLNINSSEILQSVEGDVQGVFNMIGALLKIITEGLTAFLIGVFIFWQDPVMALGIVGLAFTCLAGTAKGFKNLLKKNGKKNRKYTILKYQNVYQAANGIKEIKVMNREKFFTNNYKELYNNLQKTKIVQNFVSIIPERIIESVCVAGLITIVCMRIAGGGEATEYIAQLASFAVAAFRILPSLARIVSGFNNLVFSKPSLDAAFANILETKEYDKNNLEDLDNKKLEAEPTVRFERELSLHNVVFKYPNTERNVLERVDISIRKGESVALIGTSGAGKSTIADIVLGLLKPEKGIITLDGIDISTIKKQWCKIVGYVPQSVFLADDTLRNNIAFGVNLDKINDENIWKALEQAQLREFVESLPDKLDTVVGERGVRFSGGQRQRVAIARALYYDPEILILDEATAALDNDTEKALMNSIEALQGRKTLIIVAHRLTTIRKCDKVYEVLNGKARRTEI